MDKTNVSNMPAEQRLIETITIEIAGMTCDHCARKVEHALRALPGIKDVKVDRFGALAHVSFDRSVVDVPAMHDALLKSGYKPQAVPRS